MFSVVENFKTGKLELAELPAPICRPGTVLVANRASLISAGTEKAAIALARKTLAGKAAQRPDLVRQVISKLKRDGLAATVAAVRAKLDSPIALGYSCAGVVIESAPGVADFAPGDRVACAGAGWATHSEIVSVPKNLCARIPDGVTFEDASYITLGAIAMHGVRQANLSLGETAGVIGCGLLGLLSIQILSAAGVKVLAVDISPQRLELARKVGAAATATASSTDIATLSEAISGGIGLDAVLLTAATASNDPIRLAARLARDRGTIVCVGDVGMHIRRRSFYEKELTLVMSRSYGPGRYDPNYEEKGIEYPPGYVRWGQRRNLQEFLDLVAAGKVDSSALTTHTFGIADALEAYDLVMGKRREPYLGIVLAYGERPDRKRTVDLPRATESVEGDRIGVGFVGAGAFAQSVLLPSLKKVADFEPVVICSAGGLSAGHAGRKFGFRRASTDFQEVLEDGGVDAVVVATRHNLHAEQVAAALDAGKHVYVEKPLAITADGLERVRSAHAKAGRVLMVGFNRRWSPHTLRVKQFFAGATRPVVINYRVNAGVVARDSWIQDAAEGGGRILGEVCHFIDLAACLAGGNPLSVYARRTGGPRAAEADADNLVITVDLAGGSLACITYVAAGDAVFSKERVEVAGSEKTAVIEDFRRTRLYSGGRRRTFRSRQDKGHAGEMAAFARAVREGRAAEDFETIAAVTLATMAVELSLATGAPVSIEEVMQSGKANDE